MSAQGDLQAICKKIQEGYSCCDVSLTTTCRLDSLTQSQVADALLKLGVPQAGFLADIRSCFSASAVAYHTHTDIVPIPRHGKANRRLVAPVSTLLFVSKEHEANSPSTTMQGSNIPKNTHWTDCPSPGSIVLMQQPQGQVCALLGDLVASRLKYRRVLGAVIDGRVRDIASCGELCDESSFHVWSKAFSAVGTGLEAKPWLTDAPLSTGGLTVTAGDIMVADEAERAIIIIPRSKLEEVVALLPGLKQADDNVLKDINEGVDMKEAFARHRG